MADKKEVMHLTEKLMNIQVELKAPKNQYNSFGKYKYRNIEDIQEAIKPLLDKYCVALTLSDEIVEVGGRVYVKATARLIDCISGEVIETTAYARESSDKKGMDDAQITGATSSYARKYCVSGMMLLDDTKDPDTEEYQTEQKKETKKSATPKKVQAAEQVPNPTAEQVPSRALLRQFCKDYNVNPNLIVQVCNLRQDSTEQEWADALEYARATYGG